MALRRGRTADVIDKSVATLSDADQQAMKRPEVRRWFAEVLAESLAQGGREAASEAALYWSDWDFQPRDIAVETTLWYSGRDTNVPASAGSWLHEQIPGSKLVVWPEQGHFTWVFGPELAQIVQELSGVAL